MAILCQNCISKFVAQHDEPCSSCSKRSNWAPCEATLNEEITTLKAKLTRLEEEPQKCILCKYARELKELKAQRERLVEVLKRILIKPLDGFLPAEYVRWHENHLAKPHKAARELLDEIERTKSDGE